MRGHNEGSITKRTDGRLMVQLTVDGDRLTWYAKTEKEARKLLREKLSDRDQGRQLATASQKVETYLWTWHKQRSQAVDYKTATNYAMNVRRALPYIGHVRLDRLRSAHLDALYTAEIERGLSAQAVQQLHRTLRAAFNQAVKQEMLHRNPTDGTTPPRGRQSDQAIPRPDQLAALLRGTAGHRLNLLWAVLATTGLRSGEAIALRWEDIDFERGLLTVNQTAERQTGKGIMFKPPKTPKSMRPVLLLPGILHRLREARQQQIDDARLTGTFPPSLVFTTEVGTPYDVSAINRHYHKALARCDLPPFRVHAFRHAVTSYLISRGVSAPIVQAILGHTSSRMTTEVYTHLVAAHQEQALPILDELLLSVS